MAISQTKLTHSLGVTTSLHWDQIISSSSDDVKMVLGGSAKEYDKLVLEYSVKNQLRHKGNLGAFGLVFFSKNSVIGFGRKCRFYVNFNRHLRRSLF